MDTRIDEGVDGLEVDSRIIGLIYTARMNTKKGYSATCSFNLKNQYIFKQDSRTVFLIIGSLS